MKIIHIFTLSILCVYGSIVLTLENGNQVSFGNQFSFTISDWRNPSVTRMPISIIEYDETGNPVYTVRVQSSIIMNGSYTNEYTYVLKWDFTNGTIEHRIDTRSYNVLTIYSLTDWNMSNINNTLVISELLSFSSSVYMYDQINDTFNYLEFSNTIFSEDWVARCTYIDNGLNPEVTINSYITSYSMTITFDAFTLPMYYESTLSERPWTSADLNEVSKPFPVWAWILIGILGSIFFMVCMPITLYVMEKFRTKRNYNRLN